MSIPSLIHKLLLKSQNNQSIICLRMKHDNENTWCGYVESFDENIVTLHHLTRYGLFDGFVQEQINDIEAIEFEDEYTKAYEYLSKNNSKIESGQNFKPQWHQGDDWQYQTLAQILGTSIMVALEIQQEDSYSGFIKDLDHHSTSLQCISNIGKKEGFSLYNLEDISSISINTLEHRKRKLLFDWRYHSK